MDPSKPLDLSTASSQPKSDSKASVPAFISKLMAMINDPSTDHLISWNQNGKTFTVHDANTLAKDILPHYYKHSNFTSLVRQLNMYGFHKVVGVDQGGLKTNDQTWEFIHPCVQRDKPHLLVHVKRKVQESTASGKRKLAKQDVDSVMTELGRMREWQKNVSTKFQDMERQNTALWSEVVQLRQKHAQQQRMINKIMHFLARLVSSNRQAVNGGPQKSNWQNRLTFGADQDEPPRKMPYTEPSSSVEPPIDASSVPTSVPTSMPPSSSAVLDLSSGIGEPDAATPLNFDIGDVDLNEAEHLANGLDGVQERLSSAREQLEQGGFDPALLSSIWHHASDHSPEHDNTLLPEIDVLTPEAEVGLGSKLGQVSQMFRQPSEMYQTLDDHNTS